MTASIVIDGVDYAGAIQIDGGVVEVVTMADMGAVGASAVTVDDPEGVLDLVGWRAVQFIESACAQPRLFTGYMGERAISRAVASNRVAAARNWDCTLLDLNAQLTFLVLLPNADAKRPYESEPDRMTWLLGTRAMNGITDEGLIDTTGGQFFDEADFGGEFAGAVLDSLASTAKNFYVYRNHANGHHGLFWDQPDAPVRDCTLQISNDQDDVDFSTTFETYRDAVLRRANDETWSGVLLRYGGNQWIYRENNDTADTFIRRDSVYDSSRINRTPTAEANAATFLSLHGVEFDTITCTVKLPPDKVGLVEAGMRIKVRFTHLPGYENPGFTWMRITALSLKFILGSNEFYDVTLELSMKKLAGSGGGGSAGDGGGSVFQPHTGTPAIVQRSACGDGFAWEVGVPGHDLIGFDDPPVAGNTCVVIIGQFETDDPVSIPANWTELDTPAHTGDGTPAEARIMAYSFVSDGTQLFGPAQGLDFVSGNTIRSFFWELAGVGPTPTDSARASSVLTNNMPLAVSGSGGIQIYGTGTNSSFTQPSWDIQAPADMVCLTAQATEPRMTWAEYVGDGITIQTTNNSHSYWGGFSFYFSAAELDNVPAPGQEVAWSPADDVTPGSTTTTAATHYPYKPGSLEVKVDGILIDPSHIDETDPETGAFTLDWVIDADETVTVHYTGA